MTPGFEHISLDEYHQLRRAVALITVLIAGADDSIDRDELKWAEKVRKIRAYNLPDKLRNFYQDVGVDYADVLQAIIDNAPAAHDLRQEQISAELRRLNPILKKMNKQIAYELYHSYRSFAKHVAKASGGFLGFASIGPDEKKVLDLHMLDEITLDDDGRSIL